MNRRLLPVLVLAGLPWFGGPAFGQIPRMIPFQGVLGCSQSPNEVREAVLVNFSLYDAPESETPLWTEDQAVAVQCGYYSALLGSVQPFGEEIKFDRPYWIGVWLVDQEEELPRVPLGSAPYALAAVTAENVYNSGQLEIRSGSELTISSQDEWITIDSNSCRIRVGMDGMIEISGSHDVTVSAPHVLTLSGGTVNIAATSGNVNITSLGATKIDAGTDALINAGTRVEIDAGTDAEIDAGMNAMINAGMNASVEGSMMLKLEGGMQSELKGGAMTTVQGGIVKIN